MELPLSAAYYPAGFPLDLSTNSRDVLESANESWGWWLREFDRQPLKIQVTVQPQGALATAPTFRRQGHLFCIVSDSDNFALADLRLLEGAIFVSEQTAADHVWLRWFFLESTAYTLLAQRYAVPVHAACVAHQDEGVLLCGPSGAGKSTLSFACAREGWTYLADDATWLLPESAEPIAIGRPTQARFRPDGSNMFPELGRYAERVRPNGKLSIEIPLRDFPGISTARKCHVRSLVRLDRRPNASPRLERIQTENIIEVLLQDSASYGEDADRRRERTVGQLRSIAAYRLSYERLEDALELLSELKK